MVQSNITPPIPSWRRDLFWLGGFLLLGTIVFWLTDWDIALQGLYYHPATATTQAGFEDETQPFWNWLYHYGIFIGYAEAVGALVLITLSYWNERWLQARKAAVLMVLVVVLGPGLVANLIFKDHYGRPRPREVVQFGGTEPFSYVWQTGREGKSFPCGHCTMGFYMAVPYLFWRRNRPLLAYTSLVAGIGFGLLLGISRVRVGAHWPSDVLWGAGFVWLIALALYHLLKVYQPIVPPPLTDDQRRRKARRATWLVGGALPVITIGLLLATPYISHKELYVPQAALQQARTKVVHLSLGYATVQLQPGTDTLAVTYRVNAFGFPNSKIHYEWSLGADTARYAIVPKGWFTEIKNNIVIRLPADTSIHYHIHIKQGKALRADGLKAWGNRITFQVDKGEVE